MTTLDTSASRWEVVTSECVAFRGAHAPAERGPTVPTMTAAQRRSEVSSGTTPISRCAPAGRCSTPLGSSLQQQIWLLKGCAEQHINAIAAARAEYDAGTDA